MDESLLADLGLNQGETKVYKAIAKAKELDPAALAKATGIKRTTAYSIARGLVEKGLLNENASRRPRVFALAAPEDLALTIEMEQRRSEERQELLRRLANEVSLVTAEDAYPVPRIKFIEEDKLEQYFIQAFEYWNKSMLETNEPYFWGYQDASLVANYVDQLHHWWRTRDPRLGVKLLTNLAEGEKLIRGQYKEREVKYWGEATDFLSTTWICGDYLTMVNTRQHPFYAIEIHSRILAHDQREVFKNLWPLVG